MTIKVGGNFININLRRHLHFKRMVMINTRGAARLRRLAHRPTAPLEADTGEPGQAGSCPGEAAGRARQLQPAPLVMRQAAQNGARLRHMTAENS